MQNSDKYMRAKWRKRIAGVRIESAGKLLTNTICGKRFVTGFKYWMKKVKGVGKRETGSGHSSGKYSKLLINTALIRTPDWLKLNMHFIYMILQTTGNKTVKLEIHSRGRIQGGRVDWVASHPPPL